MENMKNIKTAPLYLVMSRTSKSGIKMKVFSLMKAVNKNDAWYYPSTGGMKKIPLESIGVIDTSCVKSYKAYVTSKDAAQSTADEILTKHEGDIKPGDVVATVVAPVKKAPEAIVVVAKVPEKVQAPVQELKTAGGKIFSAKDLEDIKCVESMLAGNKNAFTGIYKRYYNTIRQKYMGSFKYNQDIVDDLVQDLFIKVSENIDKYSSSYTFNSWITRVAKNHMLDYIRKGKLETISYDNETTGDDGESISFQPEDKTSLNGEEILLKKERIAAVTAALATLDEKTRSVVTKRYFEGLSYEEIAQEENIKESQVKILLFRAKAKMNSMLVENKYLLATCID